MCRFLCHPRGYLTLTILTFKEKNSRAQQLINYHSALQSRRITLRRVFNSHTQFLQSFLNTRLV